MARAQDQFAESVMRRLNNMRQSDAIIKASRAPAREHILRRAPVTFRLADIRTAVPGVSDQTIRLVLEQLKNEGKVGADGTGAARRGPGRIPHPPNKCSAPAKSAPGSRLKMVVAHLAGADVAAIPPLVGFQCE